jgi:uncharacterized protein (DUF1499 family)
VAIWTWLTVGILALVTLIMAVVLIYGPAKLWRLFGPADLGPVPLDTLRRRTTPNDALAAPDGFSTAKRDLVSPVYKISARNLRAAFARVVGTETQLVHVDSDDATLTDRYVQRSKLMQFPDTIIIRFLDAPLERLDGQSTVVIYSRSQLGIRDLGANRDRIERWLRKLDQAISSPGA